MGVRECGEGWWCFLARINTGWATCSQTVPCPKQPLCFLHMLGGSTSFRWALNWQGYDLLFWSSAHLEGFCFCFPAINVYRYITNFRFIIHCISGNSEGCATIITNKFLNSYITLKKVSSQHVIVNIHFQLQIKAPICCYFS